MEFSRLDFSFEDKKYEVFVIDPEASGIDRRLDNDRLYLYRYITDKILNLLDDNCKLI